MSELPDEIAELKIQLNDERNLRQAVESMAELVVNIWRRGRNGEFDSEDAFLAALETPIEDMEQKIFGD